MSADKLRQWVAEPLPIEVQRALQKLTRGEDVARVAVMPDVHLAKEVCVGVALATRHTLVPAAIGGDIGCGMSAIGLTASADSVRDRSTAQAILDGLYRAVPVIRRRRAQAQLPVELLEQPLSDVTLETKKRHEGVLQFATLGRGNHFLELQSDEDGRLWVMVHSGSRGMGQAIRAFHERCADQDRAGLRRIDVDSAAGRGYLHDVEWALRYADASRQRMLDRVLALLRDELGIDGDEVARVSCHHNFVRQETHEGEAFWVHRKGAISAGTGEPGIIPGSMGTTTFVVEGRGNARALCTSSHGAGRAMSRSDARRRITSRQLVDSMKGVWFDERLAKRLVEEAPDAYKDIRAVMRAQKDLTRIRQRLQPVLSFKGG